MATEARQLPIQEERWWRTRPARRFFRDRMALAGAILALLFVLMALLAPVLAPYDPFEQRIARRLQGPSADHWLGTDEYGRDVLSRLIYGSRASLLVGLLSVAGAGVTGTILGVVAGFAGGRVNSIISGMVNLLMSFPSLLLGLIVVVVIGPGTTNVIVAVGISMVPNFIRLARGPTLALREREFVQAAQAAGAPGYRIIWKHVLPNVLGSVSVMSTLWIATAIRTEASLSFLGLGVQPPTPSWGNMIKSGVDNLLSTPWLAVFSGLVLTLMVLAFNMMGDGLRDALDPRDR